MFSLSNKYEKKIIKQGCFLIAGLDEVGRGSWAGPLIAGLVILKPNVKIKGIKDSKLLSPVKREQLFLQITKNCVAWSIGLVNPKEIDEIGILPANRLAFSRAINRLPIVPDYLLVDGLRNFDSPIKNEFIVKGDTKIMSIAAASIVAKVVRDRLLVRLHAKYPAYFFNEHKGYGTQKHLAALQKHGISEVHRLSFQPMREMATITI